MLKGLEAVGSPQQARNPWLLRPTQCQSPTMRTVTYEEASRARVASLTSRALEAHLGVIRGTHHRAGSGVGAGGRPA